MKDQWFGDDRDLFKYDLIYTIVHTKRVGLPRHFTFIPMLTNDDSQRKKGKPGTNNPELVHFLDMCIKSKKRNINQLENFFKDTITIYKKDDEDKYFSEEQRKQYFEQVPDKLLKKSLILVDPDNGLEPVGKTKKEHVKYCEVKSLYDRMDKSSILMIFQDLARKSPKNYIRQTFKKFNNEAGADQTIHIHDGKTLFFFLAKSESTKNSLNVAIEKYSKRYEKLKWGKSGIKQRRTSPNAQRQSS